MGEAGTLTEPGWKSDIEKHIFLFGWKRPDGVNIYSPTDIRLSQPPNNRSQRTHLDPGGLERILWRKE